ncbi:MAG TPA: sigma-54 dependent transcriptional regulator [Chitinophagales bacterium]|nr:sigma-54 dependent transcriptional regulator [Chitinophagales bacterium]
MELQSIKQRFKIIGNSPALNNALDIAVRVASTNLSVLITGESGVGKEVFSQIIHTLSSRKHENFIAVNCGAIPEGTIDSELFGHEKGAFTGAHDKRKGYFETVNNGTIFLDEIGEMPIGTQARLLRLLESGEFIKVGSSNVQKTDVRIIAATNVDLPKLVQIGKFREDLYYRLNTVPIHVPALRERKDDIVLLFRKFASDFAEQYRTPLIQLDDDAKLSLTKYRFPGNVRELKNIAEQVSVLSKDRIIKKEDILRFLPDNELNTLPMLSNGQEASSFSDREILYKMIFDIKNDLNELKKFVWNATNGNVQSSEIDFSDVAIPKISERKNDASHSSNFLHAPDKESADDNPTIIINETPAYEVNTEEQSLSLMDMEKDLIIKALEKHKNKRKDAAFDLGISERTLYRKIKEYNLEK